MNTNRKFVTRHRRGRAAVLAAVVGLSSSLALTACSVPKDLDAAVPVQTPGTENPVDSGSHQKMFSVTNDSGYRMIVLDHGGKVTGFATEATSSPTMVTLIDDSSPTDKGTVLYGIQDGDGTQIGQVTVTFIDNWYHGTSITTAYDQMASAQLITDAGTDTNGSTSVTFVNGGCGVSYAHGLGSIDQTIYNTTSSTLTLVDDDQHTNVQGGGEWNVRPPATIAPAGCAEINGYTDNVITDVGFDLNATYSFETSSGTQYVVFSNGYSPEVPTGGGIQTQSAVYTALPVLSGGGWLGNVSTTYGVTNSATSPARSEHPHTSTVLSPK